MNVLIKRKNVLKPNLHHFKKMLLDLNFYVFVIIIIIIIIIFVFLTVEVHRWVTEA